MMLGQTQFKRSQLCFARLNVVVLSAAGSCLKASPNLTHCPFSSKALNKNEAPLFLAQLQNKEHEPKQAVLGLAKPLGLVVQDKGLPRHSVLPQARAT